MYIDILILSQLLHGPKHGYEIKKNVGIMLGKSNTINNNYLYPTLKRFEEMGAVTKQFEQQNSKPNRFIYSITEQGQDIFYELLNEFPEEYSSNQNEIYNRLAFFELLDPSVQLTVLKSRISYLQENMAHLNELNHSGVKDQFLPFSIHLYHYSYQLLQKELEIFERMLSELE